MSDPEKEPIVPDAGEAAQPEATPEADIPRIKKVEVRRKKKGGGFTWRWGARSGTAAGVRGTSQVVGSMGGVAGGAGQGVRMAASSAAVAGRAGMAVRGAAVLRGAASVGAGAANSGGLFSRFLASVGRVVSTAAGRAFLLATLLSAVTVAVVMMMRAAGVGPESPANLAALASSIRRHGGTDARGLYFAGQSTKGNLQFHDPAKPGSGPGSSGAQTSDGPVIGESSPEEDIARNDGVSRIQGASDQLSQKYGQLSNSISQGENSAFFDSRRGYRMGLNNLEAFKADKARWKGTGSRMGRSSTLRDDQLMTNAKGRRLDGRNLHRLRRMYDYNPRMTTTGAQETTADVAEAQFSGMEVGAMGRPLTTPPPVDGKTVKSMVDPNTLPECGPPFVGVPGACGCPSGSVQTANGCDVVGGDSSAWTGMLEDAYEKIVAAIQMLVMLAIILLIVDIAIVIGWAVTACSASWLGWLIMASIRIPMGIMAMSMANSLASQIAALGDQIAALGHGAGPIGEAVEKMSKPFRTAGSFMPIPLLGGLLATLYIFFDMIPTIKEDLQEATDAALANQEALLAEAELQEKWREEQLNQPPP